VDEAEQALALDLTGTALVPGAGVVVFHSLPFVRTMTLLRKMAPANGEVRS
jgi:hypothetical protein